MLTITNKITGEVYDLPDDTPQGLKDSWLLLTNTIKAMEQAREKLKPKVINILNERGQYDFGDYVFKQVSVQRRTYDKAIMRRVLDQDLYDLMLKPDKKLIDEYLKDNLEVPAVGQISTELRATMLDDGEPYNKLYLEKAKRDE